MSIRKWSSDFMVDPPILTVPIGGTTYTFGPEEASWLHWVLGEFLTDLKEWAPQHAAEDADEPLNYGALDRSCDGFHGMGT